MTNVTTPNARAPASKLSLVLNAIHNLSPVLADRAARHDLEGSFVAESYAELKEAGLLVALVPTELGGDGLTYREMCEVLRILAHACPSSALTLSMHQHRLRQVVLG